MEDFEQGRHLATDQSNSNNSSIEQNEISEEPNKNQLIINNDQGDYNGFQRSKPSFKFYEDLGEGKDLTFFKIHTVEHEAN